MEFQALFHPLYDYLQHRKSFANSCTTNVNSSHKAETSSFKSGFVRFARRVMFMDGSRRHSTPTPPIKLSSDVTQRVAEACSLINHLISTFSLYIYKTKHKLLAIPIVLLNMYKVPVDHSCSYFLPMTDAD